MNSTRNTKSDPPQLPERLAVTVPEAARMVALSPRSIWRAIALGRLKTVRFGRSVRVTLESVRGYVARGGAAE